MSDEIHVSIQPPQVIQVTVEQEKGINVTIQQGIPGLPGKQGEQGIQGPPGKGVPAGGQPGQVLAKSSLTDYDTRWVEPSGNTVTCIADTGGVNTFQMVFMASNAVQTANSSNVTMAGRVVGMTTEAAGAGESVSVQTSGPISNSAWDLTPGSVYYFDNGGNPVASSPTVGFVQKIGIAENSTILILQIEPPIILG
jgi:hypothetical protein